MPGEAAGALLVGPRSWFGSHLMCEGIGFAQERATENGDEPLRADGLTAAITMALSDAGCQLHELDFRITDNSGEQVPVQGSGARSDANLRDARKSSTSGIQRNASAEVGTAIGPIALAVARTACRKGYRPVDRIFIHAGNDAGQHGAAVFQFEGMRRDVTGLSPTTWRCRASRAKESQSARSLTSA